MSDFEAFKGAVEEADTAEAYKAARDKWAAWMPDDVQEARTMNATLDAAERHIARRDPSMLELGPAYTYRFGVLGPNLDLCVADFEAVQSAKQFLDAAMTWGTTPTHVLSEAERLVPVVRAAMERAKVAQNKDPV